MTVKLAITGKGGSGKTTIVKAFMSIFKEMYPEKSILLFMVLESASTSIKPEFLKI